MTKTIKKSVAFLSAAVMVMAMLLYFPSGTFSNIDWGLKASAVDMTQPSGDGSSDTPYQIGKKEELYWFAAQVNSGNTSANAVLTADIIVNKGNVENAVANCGGTKATDWIDWTPIGDSSKKYIGTFDGKGHKISGLYFNDTSQENGLYVGLFGYVGPNGSVSNVGVVDSYFNGKSYVGGVCGWNYGYGGTATITNCYNTGSVNGSDNYVGGVCGYNYAQNGTAKITNCYNTGSVRGTENVGGVCGANYAKDGTATITNCYNTGTVTATAENQNVDANAGGVCGYNYAGSGGTATITNCYNTGTVSGESKVGGVCGQNSASDNGKATITNCYNTGTVRGEESRVGGVCGYNCATSETATATITNCYNSGTVEGTTYVGGVCGFNYAESGGTATITKCYFDSEKYIGNAVGSGSGTATDVEGKTTAQFESGEVCGLVGYHSQFENGFCGLCDNGYQPATLLNNDNLNGLSENYIGYYAIENAGQLYWFAGLVNGTLDEVTQNASANAVLTANITVNTGDVAGCNGTNTEGWRDWTPIGNNSNRYTGTFDGQNHKISGLYFNNPGTECVGLFGCVGIGGSVSNVGVVDSYFKGEKRVGGVCGFNINDSNGTATATITNCYNSGSVNGSGDYVGGVCGESRVYSSNKGTGTATATITNCYNTGAVSGNYYVGGVCGYNYAYSIGQAKATATITNCYNTGDVTASGDYVGGVCGRNHAALFAPAKATATITNCYNTGDVTASGDYVGSVCEFNSANSETATITDCYYLATGETDSIDGTTFKTLEQFGSGEVCYLLNGSQSDSPVWYQTIDTDSYPLLDNNHGTVYASAPCPSNFSNTKNVGTAEHIFAVDTENRKTHKCTNCGETHNAKFTADDTADTISICCDSDKVTLKAPTQLTYDGKEKKATVEGNIDGFDTPDIVYDNNSTTAPKNAGSHTAIITYTDANSKAHSLSVGYTIAKADPDGDINPAINVVSEVGEFTEPNFTGVDGNTLEGTIKYTISGNSDATADDVKDHLKTLSKGSNSSIGYTFTPVDTNYNTASGTINFTVVNVEFKVGGEIATAANAVTIKKNPTYGDTWEEILKLNNGLTAVLSGEAVTGGFSLDVTGSPNAGSQTYKVLFSGIVDRKEYNNLAVVYGTVYVKQKLLTVSADTYNVSKKYDKTIGAGTGSGTLSVSGIINDDDVTVNTGNIDEYSGSDVGNDYEVAVAISLSGDKSSNYTLGEVSSIKVPAEITKATQPEKAKDPIIDTFNCSSVTLKEEAGYEYSKDGTTWQDSNVFTGLTAGTEYTFYQRIKATTNYEASASSTGVSQTTAVHNYTAKTRNSQTLYRYATCKLAAKYYYSCSVCGDVSKSSTFTYGSALGHNYTKQVISDSAKISDATCTSPAKYHYSCSRCNLVSTSSSYVFEYGDVKAHSYKEGGGGICSECNNLKNGKDGFKSVSVTLTDGVIINYFLLLSDTALADKNAYIHFTSAQGVNTKIKLSEGVKDSEGRYKFKLELLPDQMADEITAQVVYSDNTKGNSKAYSVKEYAAAVDNSENAQAVKDLADAMLNFGAFTQLYTGENTDNLAADVKDYTENAVIGDEYKHKLTSNISDITVKGATLQIGAYTTIRVKYQLAAGAKIEDFTFKCGDTVLTPEKSGDYYYVYLRNIRPQNLDAMYSFTVSDKTGASATLDYSAFSYMKSILDNADKYDKKVVNLINAMYDYNKAAEAISSN